MDSNNGNGTGANVTPTAALNQGNAPALNNNNGPQSKPMVSMMRQGG